MRKGREQDVQERQERSWSQMEIQHWVTSNIAQNDRLTVETILGLVVGETVNCSLSKLHFGNVL